MRRLSTALCIAGVSVALAASADGASSGGHDWTRFGWSPSRSSAPPFATGITARNVGSLRRQQVQLDGTADSSPIYLHAVRVGGGTHDVFFVTTTYGKTEAIDADTGSVLWRFTPPTYNRIAGTAQITNASPAAATDRSAIYAAAPDGRVRKLRVSKRATRSRAPSIIRSASSPLISRARAARRPAPR